MNLDIGVILIGFAGKQRLDLARMGFLTELDQRLLGLGDDVLVTLLLAESNQLDIVVKLPAQAMKRIE